MVDLPEELEDEVRSLIYSEIKNRFWGYNPIHFMELARNLVRYDECEDLFSDIRKLLDEPPNLEYHNAQNDYLTGWISAIEEVLNILDGRMSWLREE
jgi:hypothetical protein